MAEPQPSPEPPLVAHVVLDTCIVQAEGFVFRTSSLRSLLAAARLGRIRICFPEVAVTELADHYSAAVHKNTAALQTASRNLRRLRLGDYVDEEASLADDDKWSAAYDTYLRALAQEHGAILALPAVSHEVLLRSVVQGRKPFTAGDKGYKDALIWHSVLELAIASDEPVWFVTSNTRDFHAKNRTTLAEDLNDDLAASGIGSDDFRIFTDLSSLLDEVLPTETDARDQLVAFVRSTAGGSQLMRATDDRRVPLTAAAQALPSWMLHPEATTWHDVRAIDVRDARPLGDGSYSVAGTMTGRATVDGEVDERDTENPDDNWMIWDDWGEGYTVAYGEPQLVEAGFAAVFRPPDQIDDVELTDARLLADRLSPVSPNGLTVERVAWEIASTLLRHPADELVAVWREPEGWGWRLGGAPTGVNLVAHDRVTMGDQDPTGDLREIGGFSADLVRWLESLASTDRS